LAEIEQPGLTANLLEIEVQGYTVLKSALSDDQIKHAKAAVLSRAEGSMNHSIDPESATAEEFSGTTYQHFTLTPSI
jgi:hypothetical protein